MRLTTKQKQYLKGLAHNLKPVVQLGNNGLTESVIAEVEQAINHHELIKIKIPTDNKEEKFSIIEAILEQTSATKVQTIGHVLVIFKPSDKEKISLPRN